METYTRIFSVFQKKEEKKIKLGVGHRQNYKASMGQRCMQKAAC